MGLNSYFSIAYLAIFLPVVIVAYALIPRRFRWVVLLAASYVFFWLISGKLIVFILISTLTIYGVGIKLDKLLAQRDELIAADKSRRKELKAQYARTMRIWVAVGVGINIALLAMLKYLTFFSTVGASLLSLFGVQVDPIVSTIGAPIGISFYSLMAASYVFDVYRGTAKADRNIARLALFLSFFPQIMEGPICRYTQTAESLWAGRDIEKDNLYRGAVRIMWGLAKKLIVADRLNLLVKPVFADYASYDGGIIALAAIAYTLQLYCDFSGAMDVALGTARIFGVELPENFNHPFFSRTASEFWKRWHITLGTWLRDYIFYPISLSKPLKNLTKAARKTIGNRYGPLVAGAITLFCVWFANGLWHGAGSQYIFFGLYYFVIILLGGFIEPLAQTLSEKLHYSRESRWYKGLQIFRTLIVIFVGELFFRAEGLDAGLAMFGQMVAGFTFESFTNGAVLALGMSVGDFVAIAGAVVILLVVGIIEERGTVISAWLCEKNLAVRWVVLLVLIFSMLIIGSYGFGAAPLEPIYAQF